jgi:hypothetical protein
MARGKKSSKKKTAVSFSNVRIREYPIIIGDNPSILIGIPITIDWTHVREIDCSIDEYEAQKLERRTIVELRIPSKIRDDMLKEQGFSLIDRRNGMKAANIESQAEGQRTKIVERFQKMNAL